MTDPNSEEFWHLRRLQTIEEERVYFTELLRKVQWAAENFEARHGQKPETLLPKGPPFDNQYVSKTGWPSWRMWAEYRQQLIDETERYRREVVEELVYFICSLGPMVK